MRPRLYPASAYALAAIAAWYLFATSAESLPRQLLALLFFLAMAAGVLSLLNWLAWTTAARYREYVTAAQAADLALNDSRLALVRALASLSGEQVEAMRMFRATIGVVPGINTAPMYRLEIAGCNVEWDFIDEFMAAGGPASLPEIRRWSEGSRKREQASALTNFFVANHFAKPAAGNQAAAWLDRAGGLAAIGYEE